MRAIELFAGAGGLGLGLSKAGFTPVQVVERDHWCCDTIRENRKNSKALAKWPLPTESDIHDVDFRKFEGKIGLVSGGPPCQPFSLGGKHRAHADQRDMWPEAVRAIRETRPKAFVFENVKGLTRAAFASYFNYILLQLHYPSIEKKGDGNEKWEDHFARLQQHHTSRPAEKEEYRVVADLVNAANFGVPQRRERVVFVGFRADLELKWSFPEKTHSLEALLWNQCRTETYWDRHRIPLRERTIDASAFAKGASQRVKPKTKPWVTTRDAIGTLPDPEGRELSPKVGDGLIF